MKSRKERIRDLSYRIELLKKERRILELEERLFSRPPAKEVLPNCHCVPSPIGPVCTGVQVIFGKNGMATAEMIEEYLGNRPGRAPIYRCEYQPSMHCTDGKCITCKRKYGVMMGDRPESPKKER